MDFNEIQSKIDMGVFKFKCFEQDIKYNQLIIILEEPSNQIMLCDPPRTIPSIFHKIVYGFNSTEGNLCILEHFIGKEKTIPAQTKIIWE